METGRTLYEWCLLNNIQILDLEKGEEEEDYMLKYINLDEFKDIIEEYKTKANSTPRKPEKYLELRMYGLVPYNLSPMQQGIQYDHAKDVYKVEYGDDESFNVFLREWKTTIILNGGTSNEGHLVRQGFKDVMYIGSMQDHLADLKINDIRVSTFYEADLNSMLTAIVFLVDERVFNKKLYPDFVPPVLEGETVEYLVEWGVQNDKQYNNWVNKIGGPKNVFLRTFLKGKKLA